MNKPSTVDSEVAQIFEGKRANDDLISRNVTNNREDKRQKSFESGSYVLQKDGNAKEIRSESEDNMST